MLTIKVDVSKGLEGIEERFKSSFLGSDKLKEIFSAWATVYRASMQDRFDIFSKGGGTWQPLALSTIIGRRHGGKGGFKRGRKALSRSIGGGGGQTTILRDTGLLFMALSPNFGQPGQLEEIDSNGVTVGFGGGAPHADSALTIADIAGFHQRGGGRLPQRQILVEPNKETLDLMQKLFISGAVDFLTQQ